MSILKYPTLFEPIRIGKLLFRNRICSSPQDNPDLTAHRFLTEDAIAFYERKAKGGFASVCVGDFMVEGEAGRSHPFQLIGDDIEGKVCFTRTSSAIKRHGAIASVELNHAGGNAAIIGEKQGYILGVSEGVSPTGIPVRQMDEARIEELIYAYAKAASFARMCGFDMITLHGGHGWLLHQFLSPHDNRRTDSWGGSFENRMKFPLAVIEAVRNAVGNSMPIEIRISAEENFEGGYDTDYGIQVAKALDGKVDLIHVSTGHHENEAASAITHPGMFMDEGCNVHYAVEIKKHVKTPVATVGALTDPAYMEELVASGKVDMLMLARQTLADPDLPLKARTGHEDDINRCMRCLNCFSNSTVGGVFYCATNPEIGHEREDACLPPVKVKKTVLVAGGGIGGMQAAITCAERGHSVILCEKSDKLGGVLHCEAKVPFKDKLAYYLDLQARRIAKLPIDVRLNTEVTPEYAKFIGADVIIAALGSRPVKPPVKGIDGANVLGAEEVYYAPEKVPESAVIMGGGLVGLELGVWLAQMGRTVTVVEMMPSTIAGSDVEVPTSEKMRGLYSIALGEPVAHGSALKQQIKQLPNMKVFCSTKALEVVPEGLVVEGPNGVRTIEADAVIYAIGQRPLSDEAAALHDCAGEFYMIGDCVTPKNIAYATQNAYQIARDIGRI